MSKNPQQEKEALNNHIKFSQALLADQYKCSKYPENSLINWFMDDPPTFSTELQHQAQLPLASPSTSRQFM